MSDRIPTDSTTVLPQTSAAHQALAALTEACMPRADGSRVPLRWCRRLYALGIADGFVVGLQAVPPNWISPDARQALLHALVAADADTAAAGTPGAALLRQDGRHAFLHRPVDGPRHRSVPIYVRAAFAALAEAAEADGPVGLTDPRLSAHERLRLAERLHLRSLLPAPDPGPTPQRLLFLRTHGHFLLLEHRPDADLPRLLGLHA
jgi:hypothetical protein